MASRLFFLFCFLLQERIHCSPYKFGRRGPGLLADALKALHLVRAKVDVSARLHCAAKYTPLWQHKSIPECPTVSAHSDNSCLRFNDHCFPNLPLLFIFRMSAVLRSEFPSTRTEITCTRFST